MAGTVKAYGLPIDYVLYDMSYVNVLMYNAVIPSYHSRAKKRGRDGAGKKLRADDPSSRDEARRLIMGMV